MAYRNLSLIPCERDISPSLMPVSGLIQAPNAAAAGHSILIRQVYVANDTKRQGGIGF